MNRLKRAAKDMHLKVSRGELLGPNRMGTSRSDDPYQDERTRLLAGTQTLDDGSRRLDDATRIALETEALGADILRSLGQDRERIEGTRDTVCSCELDEITAAEIRFVAASKSGYLD